MYNKKHESLYMLFNIVGFNLSWFGLVLLGNAFIPVSLLMLCYHFYWCKHFKEEIKLIASIVCIGFFIDMSLFLNGVLIFPDHQIIPLWLIVLWGAFASTIAYSLSFLAPSKCLQALVGGIFPPLSYLAGASLSSIELGYSQLTTFSMLAITWAILMVLFFKLKEFFYIQVIDHA